MKKKKKHFLWRSSKNKGGFICFGLGATLFTPRSHSKKKKVKKIRNLKKIKAKKNYLLSFISKWKKNKMLNFSQKKHFYWQELLLNRKKHLIAKSIKNSYFLKKRMLKKKNFTSLTNDFSNEKFFKTQRFKFYLKAKLENKKLAIALKEKHFLLNSFASSKVLSDRWKSIWSRNKVFFFLMLKCCQFRMRLNDFSPKVHVWKFGTSIKQYTNFRFKLLELQKSTQTIALVNISKKKTILTLCQTFLQSFVKLFIHKFLLKKKRLINLNWIKFNRLLKKRKKQWILNLQSKQQNKWRSNKKQFTLNLISSIKTSKLTPFVKRKKLQKLYKK